MKKITVLLIVFVSLFGCGDDVEFNTPSMQANRNGDLWRATFYAADIDFGGFIFEGGNGTEVVQLITPADTANPGFPFELGPDTPSEAIFRDAQGVVYSTRNAPDPSLTLYPAEGEIEVEFVDTSSEPFRITGNFWFTAYSEDGLRTVNFNEGVFHRIPLLGGLVAIGTSGACLEASEDLATAQETFLNTASDAPDYVEVCNAYKEALQTSIDACGDIGGTLQVILDGLSCE